MARSKNKNIQRKIGEYAAKQETCPHCRKVGYFEIQWSDDGMNDKIVCKNCGYEEELPPFTEDNFYD